MGLFWHGSKPLVPQKCLVAATQNAHFDMLVLCLMSFGMFGLTVCNQAGVGAKFAAVKFTQQLHGPGPLGRCIEGAKSRSKGHD